MFNLVDIVNIEHTNKVIDGLHFVFVELPKFKPQSVLDKKMMVLWLRFLTEMHDDVREIPDEFIENPEINKAVRLLEESSYTAAQLSGYEDFWDAVMVERTIKDDALKYGTQQGLKQGLKEGLEQGMKKGMEIGMEKVLTTEKRLHEQRVTPDFMLRLRWRGIGFYAKYSPCKVLNTEWGPSFRFAGTHTSRKRGTD